LRLLIIAAGKALHNEKNMFLCKLWVWFLLEIKFPLKNFRFKLLTSKFFKKKKRKKKEKKGEESELRGDAISITKNSETKRGNKVLP